MEIRALRPSDDRSDFRSGDADLDCFLQKYAGQNQFRLHIGTTYVAAEGDRVLGYATVAAAHVEIDGLPARVRKKLPRYPLPVLRLARLAVHVGARGQGLGKELLCYVFELARRMARDFGCVGVVVDAMPAAERFYRKYGFLPIDVTEGQAEARPRPVPLFIPLSEIVAAGGEGPR